MAQKLEEIETCEENTQNSTVDFQLEQNLKVKRKLHCSEKTDGQGGRKAQRVGMQEPSTLQMQTIEGVDQPYQEP